jgi:hypothetical protein
VVAACVFCWPVFLGRIMSPADMLLLMLPWKSLAPQFGFTQPHNPMLDPIQQYLPWRIYAVQSLRAGLVPLWNPYSFLGTPFLANLQSTLLYPPNVLFLIFGAAHGFGVSAIFHLAMGGLFMLAFLRALGLRPAAGVFSALVFMFNGYTVAWLEYPTLSLWTFMWLPGILLCYERALQQPRSAWPALCALLVGMQFLGGHLQISSYLMLVFAIYALVRAIALRSSRSVGALLLALAPVAFGLALAAGQVLPTMELARYSGRVSRGPALTTAFPLTHFVLYLMPNFFGNPVHYNYWGQYRDPSAINFFETAAYVGILPLLLAAWSLRRWREQSFAFFAALTIVAVLAAVGSPVYYALYAVLPGFRELAGLGRILCLAAFGIAGLAAMGLDDLLAREQPVPVGRAPIIFAAAAVLLVGGLWYVLGPVAQTAFGSGFAGYQLVQIAAFAALLAASLALLAVRGRLRAPAFAAAAIALVAVDLFGFGIGFNPFVSAKLAYPAIGPIPWLQRHAGHDRVTSLATEGLDWFPHNASMIYGLRDIHGSDSLRVASSFALVSPPDGNQSQYPNPDSPLLDRLGVRYLVTERPLSGKWRLVHDGEAPVYENTRVQPRAYLELPLVDHGSQRAEVGGAGLSLPPPPEGRPQAPLVRRGMPEGVQVRVQHGAGRLKPAPPDSASSGAAVSFTRDEADHVVLEASAPAQGATLILTDSYFPGWRAWVDRSPARVERVGEGFRGVVLAAGNHTVEMRYRPASYRVGLFVSLVALALVLGAGAALFSFSRASAADTLAGSKATSRGVPSIVKE